MAKRTTKPTAPVEDDEPGASLPTTQDDLRRIVQQLGLPPDRNHDGTPNPDYYRAQVDILNLKRLQLISNNEDVPSGFEQLRKSIVESARLAGITDQELSDRRTPEQRRQDEMTRLLSGPDGFLKVSSNFAESLLESMEKTVRDTEAMIAIEIDKAKKGLTAPVTEQNLGGTPIQTQEELDRIRNRGKEWCSLLTRARRLRELARPDQKALASRATTGSPANRLRACALMASEILCFMLYVGRSNIPERKAGAAADSIYTIAGLHVRFAVGLWEAQHGIAYDPEPSFGKIPYTGAILVGHPRSGKSEVGAHWVILSIVKNPYEQIKVGHAVGPEAVKNVGYIKTVFDPYTDAGQRLAALYPGIHKSKDDDTQDMMRLELDGGPIRDPTLTAHGTGDAISGGAATKIWLDDPVDQREHFQSAERERKFLRINGTWLTRRTGKKAFDLTTTTLWHPEDANCRRIKMARAGEINVRVVVAGAGGPDSVPPFRPVVPELGMDEAYLREKYASMRNPELYACVYGANPMTARSRKIRKLRFYDPLCHEHESFKRTASMHLSIDPAATNRSTSDPAGVVYAGLGWVETTDVENDRETTRRHTQLRILDAVEVPSTQAEIAEYALAHSKQYPVDWIHVETRSGYAGTAEMLSKYLGIENVQTHDPGPKNKGVRLQQVAGLIDEAVFDAGGPHASVLFPGRKDENGDVVGDPNFYWLYAEFLEFGQVNDHCVDAVTQLVHHHAPDLDIDSRGSVSRQANQIDKDAGKDPRALAAVREIIDAPARTAARERSDVADYLMVCSN